ncbi:Swt1 family HEPN domain-containing protein [Burkholderia ubonensis]|uniref:Swt1 family HEPN domain-containing protein n=1 Tax=Burkholderia ubonensis TaxID=101571 RepID=UPI0012BB1AE3|nr:Swt1 family HEPN domain-containing protein [Burkholderia ubonensis]
MTPTDNSDWHSLSAQVQHALSAGWSVGAIPPAASALYSRWWQLETWLRSLAYVELRSEKGSAWAEGLAASSADRQQRDAVYHYMQTPDAQDQLAYLDAGPLLKLTLDHWPLFRSYLPTEPIWTGRIEELKQIRNRIGHCRRPHEDDLDRLEQALRDLEGGAFRAISSFNDHSRANPQWSDLLVRDWVHGAHADASLIEHGAGQYQASFRLMVSRRPWANSMVPDEKELGRRPGYVWHASWYFRGGRFFDLAQFWQDIEDVKEHVMLVCAATSSSLDLSFSAVDDPQQVTDTIGRSFAAALENQRFTPCDEDPAAWARRFASVDPRVHAGTPWAVLGPGMPGASIFSA